jgi:hypothetical protein
MICEPPESTLEPAVAGFLVSRMPSGQNAAYGNCSMYRPRLKCMLLFDVACCTGADNVEQLNTSVRLPDLDAPLIAGGTLTPAYNSSTLPNAYLLTGVVSLAGCR